MTLSATFLRRLHWINLPAALLLALLQRTPVLRVAASVGEIIHASPAGQILRAAMATAASLGALHSLAGATTLSVSSGSTTGVSGTIGNPLGPIAMGTIGTASQPLSWQITGTLPTGLRFLSSNGTSLTASGTLNTPNGVMLLTGTPTGSAGSFALSLRAYEGANRTLTASPIYTYTITLTGGTVAAPTITTQPANATVNAGATATFSVVATGSPNYQWRKDGADLAGATNATLSLSNASSANAGVYTVFVSNTAGSLTSNPATLTINPTSAAPVITTQPASVFSVVGGSASFTVVATGNPAPTYQWLKNSLPMTGQTSATLSLSGLTLADAANYVVNVTNTFGTVASAAATLNIDAARVAPAIVTQPPVGLSLIAGQSLALNVAASGSGLVYQWKRVAAGGAEAVAGATSATFTVKPLTVADAGIYFCTVTNSSGSVDSAGCIVAVAAASANPGRLINLSVLTALATPGDNFSLGYVVSGATQANAKPLVIRAAGPSLGALGVPGTISDPKLELFAGSTKVLENDNWGGATATAAAMAAVGGFPYASPGSLDAAVAASVNSRDNSVKISAGAAAPNAVGTVIGEVYDATTSAAYNAATTPRLVNLSVLKGVGTGLTMGFVIGGATGKTMLVRAIGPTLGAAPFNVGGVMTDPKVELFDATGKSLATNDNWGGSAALATAFGDTGAFALNAGSADAALVTTLAPGNYTAQVTVATGATGVALVEVYEVP